MNIEDIKKRLKEHQEDEDKFRWLPYEEHVSYLLSIIEQAEKAFEEINYQFELHEHEIVDNAIKNVDDIATKALQAIKGDK